MRITPPLRRLLVGAALTAFSHATAAGQPADALHSPFDAQLRANVRGGPVNYNWTLNIQPN